MTAAHSPDCLITVLYGIDSADSALILRDYSNKYPNNESGNGNVGITPVINLYLLTHGAVKEACQGSEPWKSHSLTRLNRRPLIPLMYV